MDIWKWFGKTLHTLYDTEPELVRRLDEYPSRVTDDHHAYVDAAFPELLAAVRGLGHVWLEIFVRHWWLQSSVSRRMDVAAALPEAVDLLDRVHQPDAEGCPQAICAIQDLCLAYGPTDGPGFVEERLTACREALDRIDPTWPCWRCLSIEYAEALDDDGRPAEALAFLDRQRRAAETAGGDASPWGRVREHLELGDPAAALAAVEQHDVGNEGRHGETKKAIGLARCLARLDRVEDAVQALPPWPQVRETAGHYLAYTDALTLLLDAGAVEWSAEITERVSHMLGTLERQGAWSHLLKVSVAWFKLALRPAEQRWALADVLVKRARTAQARLRDPRRADAELAELSGQADAARPEPWAGTEEEIFEQFQKEVEAEERGIFSRAVATARERPSMVDLVMLVASQWQQLGFTREAIETYVAARRSEPHQPGLVGGHAAALTDDHDWEGLERLLDSLPAEREEELDRVESWYRSVLCEERGEIAAAVERLEEMRTSFGETWPEALTARLAKLYERQGDHAAALEAWTATISQADGESHWDWERMMCATRLGRWDVVRESAIRLGMELEPGDREIDESWGIICLVDPETPTPIWAERTGPVTARVVSITGPGEEERFGERVIFEPQVLNPDEEESPPSFRMRETLEPSSAICYPWDGPRPEPERLEAFLEEVSAFSAGAFVASSDEYVQVDPDTAAEIPAVWIKVAVAEGEEAARRLLPLYERLAADVGKGLGLWPELLAACGDAEGAERHRDLQIAWRMA